MRHIILDAHSEVVPGSGGLQVVKNRLDHRRGEILRGQPVAAAHHLRHGLDPPPARGDAFRQGGDDIQVQRLAQGAGFLGPVQHRDGLDARWQCFDKSLAAEWPVEAHFNDADLGSAFIEIFHRLMRRLAARAHQHHHPLGVRIAHVLEGLVCTPGDGGKLVHHPGGDVRALGIKRVARLARLEEHIRVLRGAAQDRAVGVHGALPMRNHKLLVDHLADYVFVHQFDLRHLVRRAEAVKEVQKRDPALQGCRLGDEREIHRLLHAGRTQERKPGGAGVHHVAMVAKNGQRMSGQGARGNVEDRRRQLPRDFEHIGHFEQQALRRREGRGQRAGLERPVHRARGAAFALHLHHRGHGAPDVFNPFRCPLVAPLAHVRGGSNGIDAHHLIAAVGHVCHRLIAVNCRVSFIHVACALNL